MLFSSFRTKWPPALFAGLLSTLLVSSCTSNEDPDTNATIQNYGESQGEARHTAIVVVSEGEAPCLKEAMRKSSPPSSVTVILLDSISLEDLPAGSEAYSSFTTSSTEGEIAGHQYEAAVSIHLVRAKVIEGSFQLFETSGSTVGSVTPFRARKCPDLNWDD
jgi:hypothetical protein